MTALESWQAAVMRCRTGRSRSERETWERLARWYDCWVRHNDYVSIFMPRLLALLDPPPTSRVLEIGPGSGAFTLPLASVVKQVVAAEPSQPMRDVLTRKCASSGVNNVTVLPRRIEDVVETLEGPFDLVLAAYSMYNLLSIDQVLRHLLVLSPQVVILMGDGKPMAWRQTLYRRFKGQERVASPQFPTFHAVLLEMGLKAEVEMVWTSANYVYDDEEAMLNWWQEKLGLGARRSADLRAALREIAEYREGRIGIYGQRQTAMIRIARRCPPSP